MSEEKEEVSIATEREEREGGGPTSMDVIDNQISIGDVSFAEPQGEKVQDQNRGIERVHEESRSSKRKKRRITSYLSNISKQVDKHGNKIDKMTVMLQSLQKQKQTKSTTGSGVGQSQYQSIQQIKSQISQVQKQVARIQNDIRRIRTVPITRIQTKTKTKFRKLSPSTIAAVKPKSKRSKLLKSTKAKKRRRSRSRM